jgi:hypothetical protein
MSLQLFGHPFILRDEGSHRAVRETRRHSRSFMEIGDGTLRRAEDVDGPAADFCRDARGGQHSAYFRQARYCSSVTCPVDVTALPFRGSAMSM